MSLMSGVLIIVGVIAGWVIHGWVYSSGRAIVHYRKLLDFSEVFIREKSLYTEYLSFMEKQIREDDEDKWEPERWK